MPFDFATSGRHAREQIAVPAVPLETIARRAERQRARSRAHALAAAAGVLVAGAVAVGTGAGARILDTVHVWLGGGHAAIRTSSVSGTRWPTREEFRRAIAGATFPVRLPVGLPPNARVVFVWAMPATHPSAITLEYRAQNQAKPLSFLLADPSVVDVGRQLLAVTAPNAAVYDWRSGDEVVSIPKDEIDAAGADRLKASMAQTTPQASLAATDAMLATVAVLGDADHITLAEHYRAAAGPNALVGTQTARTIASLAARGLPMRDRRHLVVTNLHYAHGEPDYARTRNSFAGSIAVSAGGVRALATTLRARGVASGGDCACELLYSRPDARAAYRIVVIPLRGSGVRTYAVDPKTYAVRAAT